MPAAVSGPRLLTPSHSCGRCGVPGDDAGSGDEVLAALVASLRAELAGSQAALARTVEELAAARERIAELEARLRQTPRKLLPAAVAGRAGQACPDVAAEERRPQARQAEGAAGRDDAAD
jgi:hypothetical protein